MQDALCKKRFHSWIQRGLWDGVDKKTNLKRGGPVAICSRCGERKLYTHQEWEDIKKRGARKEIGVYMTDIYTSVPRLETGLWVDCLPVFESPLGSVDKLAEAIMKAKDFSFGFGEPGKQFKYWNPGNDFGKKCSAFWSIKWLAIGEAKVTVNEKDPRYKRKVVWRPIMDSVKVFDDKPESDKEIAEFIVSVSKR